jgi:TPR repeat protein
MHKGKNTYLKGAAGYDPEVAIKEAQERIDAESRKVSFFRSSIFITGVISLIAVGAVGGIFYLDQENIKNSISRCNDALARGNISEEETELCRMASNEGNDRATEGLAALYVSQGRNDLAYPYLKQCSENSNENCQYLLSNIFRDGVNGIIEPNNLLAAQLLEKASANGSSIASFTLYKAFNEGSTAYLIKKDKKKANQYLRMAGELGHPAALYLISENYKTGEYGFTEDYDKSIHYLKLSADRGFPEAIGKYALHMLETDREDLAVEYLRKGEQIGEPLSCTLIAQMYRDGRIEFKGDEYEKSAYLINLFSHGAEEGNPMAIRNLIEIYRELDDSENYIKWIKKALVLNIPEAYGYMGEAIEEEYTIVQPLPPSDQVDEAIHQILADRPNLEAAIQYYRRGTAQHDNKSFQHLLKILRSPEFNGKINNEFFNLAKIFAEENPEYGLEMLAYCHMKGIGTPVNEKAAHDLLAQKITTYEDISLASSVIRKLLTGSAPKDPPVVKNPKAAPRFAALLLDMHENGKEEYLKIWKDILGSNNQDHQQALLNIVNGIPQKYQDMLNEDDEFLFLRLKTNILHQKQTKESLAKLRNTADMLLLRENHEAEMLYANLAYSGTVFFSKPDYATAVRWYEEAIEHIPNPDPTVLFRMGSIYADRGEVKDYARGLDYLKRALHEERDLALDLIINRYILDRNLTGREKLLTPSEKYYYLKLAEMIGHQTRQTSAFAGKLTKELNDDEVLKAEQQVYEEMVRRKALENQRKTSKESRGQESQ